MLDSIAAALLSLEAVLDQADVGWKGLRQDGLLCLLLTALSTLTLLPDGFVQGGTTNKQYRLAMGVLLVLLNAAFVAWIAVQLFRLVQWSRATNSFKAFVSSMLGVVHRPCRAPGCMRLLNTAKDTCLRGGSVCAMPLGKLNN